MGKASAGLRVLGHRRHDPTDIFGIPQVVSLNAVMVLLTQALAVRITQLPPLQDACAVHPRGVGLSRAQSEDGPPSVHPSPGNRGRCATRTGQDGGEVGFGAPVLPQTSSRRRWDPMIVVLRGLALP